MRALIDLDNIFFKGCFATTGYYNNIRCCDNMIYSIIDGYYSYKLFLGGPDNFRKKLYPEYKSNRDPSKRPQYLYDVRMYFIKYWNPVIKDTFETDDVIAMEYSIGEDVLYVNDKDYKQLGGWQTNSQGEINWIDDPMLYFWIQMITGDPQDFIPGLRNPEKLHHKKPPAFSYDVAEQLLKPLPDWVRCETVKELYREEFGDRWEQELDLKGNLLWLKRSDSDNFKSWI